MSVNLFLTHLKARPGRPATLNCVQSIHCRGETGSAAQHVVLIIKTTPHLITEPNVGTQYLLACRAAVERQHAVGSGRALLPISRRATCKISRRKEWTSVHRSDVKSVRRQVCQCIFDYDVDVERGGPLPPRCLSTERQVRTHQRAL